MAYQSIPSVQEYCLVAQDEYSVKKYTSNLQQEWYLDCYTQQDKVPFVCMGCEISVLDIYAWVLES
jgi:Uma2 family endonuclease